MKIAIHGSTRIATAIRTRKHAARIGGFSEP
jgi:hypothetical protein